MVVGVGECVVAGMMIMPSLLLLLLLLSLLLPRKIEEQTHPLPNQRISTYHDPHDDDDDYDYHVPRTRMLSP